MFLHDAKAPSDGQQLPLLLLLSGEIGEEDHLTVLDVVLPGVTLHHVFVRSLLSVGGAEVFLVVNTEQRLSLSQLAFSPNMSGLTSITSRVLDR